MKFLSNSMSSDQLEMLIEQTINGAIATIPEQIKEIDQQKDALQIGDPKEFVYGLIMGMSMGLAGAFISASKGVPTEEDQLMIKNIIFKKMSVVREQIFK